MKYFEIFFLELMASNFSPSSGSYVLNSSQVSASGAIQGHHGLLVLMHRRDAIALYQAMNFLIGLD